MAFSPSTAESGLWSLIVSLQCKKKEVEPSVLQLLAILSSIFAFRIFLAICNKSHCTQRQHDTSCKERTHNTKRMFFIWVVLLLGSLTYSKAIEDPWLHFWIKEQSLLNICFSGQLKLSCWLRGFVWTLKRPASNTQFRVRQVLSCQFEATVNLPSYIVLMPFDRCRWLLWKPPSHFLFLAMFGITVHISFLASGRGLWSK